MIRAVFSKDIHNSSVSLHVDGHAGAGEYGHDIVCASASILTCVLANEVIDRIGKSIKDTEVIEVTEGNAYISCDAIDEDSFKEILAIFNAIEHGFELLEQNYRDYVSVTKFGEEQSSLI